MSITINAINENKIDHIVKLSNGDVTVYKYFKKEINWANSNAAAILQLLGIIKSSNDLWKNVGKIDIHEARRSVVRALSTFNNKAEQFTRKTELIYGAPQERNDGIMEINPVRFVDNGIDKKYLKRQVEKFSTLVNEAQTKGFTHITWG